MEITRGGYIWRLYLWGTEYRWEWENRSSFDLCSLFWTLLFKGLLATSLIVGAGWFTAFLLACIITDPRSFVEILQVVGVLGLAVIIICIGVGGTASATQLVTSTETWQFIKGNYCPQVKVKDEEY